jgi:glycosyltransferase involved in cell wall biosynthesis
MSEPQPKLSVVVPARDAASVIAGQLEALAAQKWDEPWEVVVADNGSTDRTRDVVERFRERLPGLRIVDASGRKGQAHALNVGVRAARSDRVAFCDADDEVAAGWVAAMGEALKRHDLVACRADVSRLNPHWLAEAREAPPADRLATVSFPPYAPYAGSGGVGVRRGLHERLGGFDESMRALFDVDYCLRAHSRGIELVFVPDALLHYRYRAGLRPIFGQARIYAQQMALVQRRHERPGSRPRSRKPWVLRGWKPVAQCLLSAHRPGSRAKLAWLLGWQLGRYLGSVRYRVLAN